MKKKGRIGFWIGIVFVLAMIMPSFVLADVTIDYSASSTQDLETLNGTSTSRIATVTSTGDVAVTSSDAIWARVNGWSVNVDSGGVASTSDSGAAGVNFGDATHTIYYSGTLTNHGNISGNGYGVLMGSGTVNNYNSINSPNYYGVYFGSDGALTSTVNNYTGGSIAGSVAGISFNSGGTGTAIVTNSNLISSSSGDGIALTSDGALSATIQNNVGGTIYGYNTGTYFYSTGAGNIQITNSGTITGDWGNGVYIYSEGDLSATMTNYGTINSNDTSDGYEAVYIEGSGTGTATINNYGSIYTYDDYGSGDAVSIQNVGTATVNNFGSLYSYDNNGVQIENVGTAAVNNSGSIEGYWYDAVYVEAADTVNVTNSGSIYSYDYDGIGLFDIGTATITNSGSIDAWDGIWVEGADAVTINNSGTISGEARYSDYDAYGVYIEDAGTATITNSGTISGYGEDGYDYDGIYMTGVGTATVTNNAGGTISGVSHGIYIEDSETANVTNSGTIQADNYDAIDIYSEVYSETSSATVTNNAGGTIRSLNDDAIEIYGMASATVTNNAGGLIQANNGYGISIGTTVTTNVTNSGTIQSYYDGIYIDYTDVAKVINNAGGTIQSYNGRGIAMDYFIGEEDTAEIINSGTIQAYGDGVYVRYANTATVTNNAGGSIQSQNGRGVALEYIGADDTAEVINSGTIQAFGSHGSNGIGDAVYIGYSESAKVTNNAGGFIQSLYGYGVGIEYSGGVTVANSGLIQGYINGVGIQYVEGDVSVTNNGTGNIQGQDMAGVGMQYITGTGEVVNKAGGTIQGSIYGAVIYNYDEDGIEKVTNSGTIQGNIFGVGLGYADTATVTNNTGGIIQQIISIPYGYGVAITEILGTATVTNHGTIIGYNDGVGIEDVGTANVTNTGVIQGVVNGVGIEGATGNAGEDGEWGTEDDILAVNINNSGTIQGADGRGLYIRTSDSSGSMRVTNSGTISSAGDSYNGDGVRLMLRGPDSTAELINTETGVINGNNLGGEGVSMTVSYSSSSGEITNSGIITSVNDAIFMTGYGDKSVINNAGGLIYGGVYGIRSLNGNATITNYGTITGADGTAIKVNGDNNVVTLGTGSIINGDIRANNSYADNYMILDGEGAINANQMQQFHYLDKTGTGTWALSGDMDYNSSYSGHGINIEEGVLAFADRNGSGGVYTNTLDVYSGASLGYVVTATGSTGALTTYDYAYFNTGSGIVVIPRAGMYAAETVYPAVLTVGGSLTPLPAATSTSAFLSPLMVEETPGSQIYDLILTRLSFTTGASPSNAGLAGALDGAYDTATGDMRTLLDQLITLSPGEAQTALTGLGGGSYPAFQLLSFNGMGKYLGVLNNHIGMGGAFASGNQSRGFALYGNGAQLAMGGSGNSMNDAAPMLLAAAGNIGQTQIAAGNNWGFWIDGYASTGNRRSDEVISKYKQTLYGGMLGFDFRVANNLFLGISGGLSKTDVDFDDIMDNGTMDSYHGSLYLCYNGKPWYAEGVFTYARNKYNVDRFIIIGPDTYRANGDYNGNEYNGYAEVGYKIDAGGAIIRPLAAFQIDYLKQDGFVETGAGVYNLTVDDQHFGSYQSFLGVNISGAIPMGASAVFTPELRLKWAHEFSNDDHMINARFAGMGSGSFVVEEEDLSRDTFIAGLGLNFRFNKNLAAYIQYDAEMNRDFVNHTGLLGLRVEW